MLAFWKQSPGQHSSHLPLDTHKFGMPCKCVVRYSIPPQSHLQRQHMPDSPGYVTWMGGVSHQGGSLLCSASRCLTSSIQHFSHFTLPIWRGGLSQADPCTDMAILLHGPRLAHPKPWGRINAWQGRQAGQLIPGTRRGVIFLRAGGCSLFFARGLMLICCSHLRAVRSTRRSSQELKKYETHWGSRAGSGHLLQCSISLQALSIFFTLFSVKWAATETEISRAAEDT